MHIRKNLRRTITELQNQSEAKRLGRFSTVGRVNRMAEGKTATFSKCQWIHGEPTRAEYRAHGVDNFKCLKAVKPDHPYCEEHCSRCYAPIPLTEPVG